MGFQLRTNQLQIQGISTLRDIQSIQMYEITPKKRISVASYGQPLENDVLTKTTPLTFTINDKTTQIGELKVQFSLAAVYTRLKDKVLLILITQAIKTTIISFGVIWIVHLLVTRKLLWLEKQRLHLVLQTLMNSTNNPFTTKIYR